MVLATSVILLTFFNDSPFFRVWSLLLVSSEKGALRASLSFCNLAFLFSSSRVSVGSSEGCDSPSSSSTPQLLLIGSCLPGLCSVICSDSALLSYCCSNDGLVLAGDSYMVFSAVNFKLASLEDGSTVAIAIL
jgi:hypothetical protein